MVADILPARVLFVDDDRSMRVVFANAARALGVEAVVVESGGQALELAQRGSFPVVVTDLRMPGIDGVALVERLSAQDRSLAFVLVSADPEARSDLPGRADGAIAALLAKPIEMSELHDALARAFALHQRRQAGAQRSLAAANWQLLIVEDSPGDSDLLEVYLAELPGVALFKASCLMEALKLAHDHEFDAIITDLSLPDARGFDAVLRLQASAPRAAIVAYSGVEDEALALQVVQIGAQDYLVKSVTDRESLLRSLRFARERKRAELRLRRLAHYDQLTGLANRASFSDALTQAVARAQRQQLLLAVMMVDLDGFKAINDSQGHEAGDQVLQEIGVRMRCLFREYDVVARFGGDEFAVLVTEVESLATLAEMAERLLVSLALPIGASLHRVTGSVGVAVYPDAGRSPARLLRSADVAMYQAKHFGKNRCMFFDGPVPLSSRPSHGSSEANLQSGSQLVAARVPSELLDEGVRARGRKLS